MSRDWEEATASRAETTTPAITDQPCTMACWFMPETDVGLANLIGLFDSGTVDNYHVLDINAADNVRATSRSAGLAATSATSAGTVTYGSTTWAAALATFGPTAGNDRSVVLNGATAVSNTVNRPAVGLDRIVLGCNYNGGAPIDFFDGLIAHACVWDVQLSQAEANAFCRGVHPFMIRRGDLVHYWPLWGKGSPEPDEARGTRGNLTLVNAPPLGIRNPPVNWYTAQDDTPYVMAGVVETFVPRISVVRN